jgi:hypothetical protein
MAPCYVPCVGIICAGIMLLLLLVSVFRVVSGFLYQYLWIDVEGAVVDSDEAYMLNYLL